MSDNALLWSYAFYIVCFETLVLGGTGYAVFVLHQSGWWFVLAVFMSASCIQPGSWRKILTGKKTSHTTEATQ